MWVLKRFVLVLLVSSSAAAVTAGFAETGRTAAPAEPLVQVAQDTTQPAEGAEPAEPAATEEAATEAAAEGEEEPPDFTEAFLANPANLDAGEALWDETCQHCHGSSAYPGKAPKLRPSRYTAEFVYDRVTNGFRKMPAWKDVFSQDERMSIAAYVVSDDFSP